MTPKDRIQAKASELFLRYGIRSVSMDDIAAHLGISKKTLYAHFDDKDTLVEAVLNDEIKKGKRDCSDCLKNSRNAVEEILMVIEQLAVQFSNMNPVVLNDLEKFYPEAFQKFRMYKNEFLFSMIRKNILRGIAEGLYRKDIHPEIMTKYRLETMLLPFNITVFPPAKFNLVQVTNELLMHFLYGVVSLKGYKLILKYKQKQNKFIHV